MRIFSLFSLAFLCAACSPIQHQQIVQQTLAKEMTAGVGDIIARVNKQRDLENVFGRADLYGRKTDEGYSELRFAGQENDGAIVLFRKDVDIITNETTMSRNPFSTTVASSTTSTNGIVSGTYSPSTFSGTGSANSNTTTIATTIHPTTDFHVVTPPDTIPIRIPKGTTSFPFAGYTISILSATPVAIRFVITQAPTHP